MTKQMRILSVDVGTRNFAMTLYCTEAKDFVLMRLVDLRNFKDYVGKMKEMSEEEPFKSADVLLVENQMRSIMKTMATALRAFNFDKTVMVAPQSVKRHFRTSKKRHYWNKKVALVKVNEFLTEKSRAMFEKFEKKDDIADCVLQTIWFLAKGKRPGVKQKKGNKVRALRLPARIRSNYE